MLRFIERKQLEYHRLSIPRQEGRCSTNQMDKLAEGEFVEDALDASGRPNFNGVAQKRHWRPSLERHRN